MAIRLAPLLLLVPIAGAALYAVLRNDAPTPAASAVATPDPARAEAPMNDPHGGMNAGALPPDHPPIGAGAGGGSAPEMRAPEEPAAIQWKVPKEWQTVPNPSPMRIATYRVPRAAGVNEDADMSVTRVGGSTEANIERWIGQFEGAKAPTRTEREVHGVKVTIVQVEGTYGGMMPPMGGTGAPQGAATGHPGWALLGAVVETPDMPYFFKLTGPAASVRAAKPSFDALIDSITSAASPPL